ncbi:MAG: translation initiation factor IF-3 [Bacteroidota bacterium]
MAAPFNNNSGYKPPFKKPAPTTGPRPDNRFGRGGPRRKEDLHNINGRIRATEVRVVGEGIEQGVYPIARALEIAKEVGLDLVEISPNAEPPVCKVVDYKKFLYDQKKKQKELKAKAAKTVIKEIRFGPQTDDHDFNFKKNHAIKFLQEGSKVKAFVFFKGRSILFKEQGEILLLRFVNELEEYGKPEQMPVLEGKKMIMVIAPKKK